MLWKQELYASAGNKLKMVNILVNVLISPKMVTIIRPIQEGITWGQGDTPWFIIQQGGRS